MSTFIVVPVSGTTNIDQVLPKKFGNKALQLPRGEWLVAYDGTSRQLSDDIGIGESPSDSAIILNFSAYWGLAGQDVWEWIAANRGT